MRGLVKRLLIVIFLICGLLAAPAEARTRIHTFRAGPFAMSGFSTRLPKIAIRAPHADGYITAMRTFLTYPGGRQVSVKDVMLHHTVFINHGAHPRDYRGSCEGRWGEAVYGAGEGRQSMIMPPGVGYRIHRHARWRLQAMLMSHTLRFEKVYVTYRVRVTTGRRMRHVKPFWVRANGC